MRHARSWPTGSGGAERGDRVRAARPTGPAHPAEEANRRDLDRLGVRGRELVDGQPGRGQPGRVFRGDPAGQPEIGRTVGKPGVTFDELHVEVVKGRSESDHHPRVGGDAPDLDGRWLAEREDGPPVPHEPGGHEVGVAVLTDGAQPQHRLLGEEGECARRRDRGLVHGRKMEPGCLARGWPRPSPAIGGPNVAKPTSPAFRQPDVSRAIPSEITPRARDSAPA
jgi:hypothetical protein